MFRNQSNFRKAFITILVLIFILIYLIFLMIIYAIPSNYTISIILLVGFGIILGGIFLFANTNFIKSNRPILNTRLSSIQTFKIGFLILMIIFYFIPSIKFDTIIDWKQINILNYLRAILFLLGVAFVFGESLFNVLFSIKSLHNRFKVESILIKITIYPLISFVFLGIITLLLDRIGLSSELFSPILLGVIIGFITLDIFKSKSKSRSIENKAKKYKISKSSTIILVIGLGLTLISIGGQITSKYLITGDSWTGISSAIFIGSQNSSPVDLKYSYSIYWGYISFGLSNLSGLPYININVMLTAFNYLSITSIYLLIKSILINYKEKYVVLASIFTITFSSMFYIFNPNLGQFNSEWENISMLIFDLVLNFRYKTFSFILCITSISLIFIIFNSYKSEENEQDKYFKKEQFKLVILGALFLIQSYMVFFFPLLFAILQVFLFFLFKNKNKRNFQYFFLFICTILVFFVFFDILMNFFLSWIPTSYVSNFFGLGFLSWRGFEFALYNAIFVYLIVSLLIPTGVFTYYLNRKLFSSKRIILRKLKKKTFIFFYYLILTFFSSFLIVAGILNYLTFNSINDSFFIYYFNKLFLRFGLVGITGSCLAYYCYKKEKYLFYFLVISIFLILLISSFFIFKEFFIDSGIISIHEIPEIDFFNMNYWFNRTWFYIILPISIIASIGVYNFGKKIRKSIFNKNVFFNLSMKNFLVIIFIFFSISNLFIMGIFFGRKEGKISDKEVNIIGWVSENIPLNSNLLVDRYYFSKTLEQITFCNSFYPNDIYDNSFSEINYWTTYWLNDHNCNISVMNELEGHYSLLRFDDLNITGNADLKVKLDRIQEYGRIDFWIRSTNTSQSFYCIIKGDGNTLINLMIKENSFYYNNGTEDIELYEIINNTWINISITFDGSDSNYDNLSMYHWNFYANDSKYNNLNFYTNFSGINNINFFTEPIFTNYSIFIDNILFDWNLDYKMDICIPKDIVIDYLLSKNIIYLLFSAEYTYYKSKVPDQFIKRELIPYYYKYKLYEYEGIMVYSSFIP